MLGLAFYLRAAMVAAIGIAIVLIVTRVYHAGERSEKATYDDKVIEQTTKNVETRETVENEIRQGDSSGGDDSSTNRLRHDWSRD